MNIFKKSDNLIGEKIGNITVIKFVGYKNNIKQYLCKCNCGNTFIAAYPGLINGKTKYCPNCRPNAFKDLTGKVFGDLTVLRHHGYYKFNGGRTPTWVCKCKCGKETIVRGDYLKNGHTRSCGCARAENSITHGESKTKLYEVWSGIKTRCTNTNIKAANNYVNKGVYMYKEWFDDYTVFRNWALANGYDPNAKYDKPGDKLSVERIDVNGPYTPENCKFIVLSQQNDNKTTTKRYNYNGEMLMVKEIAKKINLPITTINSRLARNWSMDKIIATAKKRETGLNNTQYVINGVSHNVYDWSKIYNIDPGVVRSRLHQGWNIEKALTEPVKAATNTITFDDCTGNFNEWARALEIPSHIIQYRRTHGWNEEASLTTPIKDKGGNIKYPMAGIVFVDPDTNKPVPQNKVEGNDFIN